MSLTTYPPQAAAEPAAMHQPSAASDGRSLAPAAMQDLVQLFKLLSDETRLKIVNFLVQVDELNVRTLCGMLAQSQPAVSHHLALLKEAGLLECRRDGKHNYYRLVTRRCQEYLDGVFGVCDGEVRRVRVESAVLTYGRVGSG